MQLSTVSIFGLCACDPNAPFVEAAHKTACKREAGIIVWNLPLWREYSSRASASHETQKREYLADKRLQVGTSEFRRLPLEYVAGFPIRFGPNLVELRSPPDKNLSRDDIFLLHRGKIVAQFKDITSNYDTIEIKQWLSCQALFPELYLDPTRISFQQRS